MSGTFIIVPAYNEESTLGDVLHKLAAARPEAAIVVVDDGSRDGTGEVAGRHAVHYLRHIRNLGQGAALQTGFDYALGLGAEHIVTFDADGQHDPADIEGLLSELRSGGWDAVLGTRWAPEATTNPGLVRRLLLRASALFMRTVMRVPVNDPYCGLRAFSRRGASSIHITQNRMAHVPELLSQLSRAGLRWTEAPASIHYTDYSRRKGQRSISALEVLADLIWRPSR